MNAHQGCRMSIQQWAALTLHSNTRGAQQVCRTNQGLLRNHSGFHNIVGSNLSRFCRLMSSAEAYRLPAFGLLEMSPTESPSHQSPGWRATCLPIISLGKACCLRYIFHPASYLSLSMGENIPVCLFHVVNHPISLCCVCCIDCLVSIDFEQRLCFTRLLYEKLDTVQLRIWFEFGSLDSAGSKTTTSSSQTSTQ